MEILVKYAYPTDGIIVRDYRTIDLENGDAASVKDAILDLLEEDGIDKYKMISTMTDWCATMGGSKGGVNKLLKDEIPEMEIFGGDPSHHLSNTIQHLVRTFDPDMKEALVDLSECISGEKGRSLKQMRAYEATGQNDVGQVAGKNKKICSYEI